MSEFLPGLAGVPATKSNISFIDGEKGVLAYRGYPIETLAEHSNFAETALLLLTGELPTPTALAGFESELAKNQILPLSVHKLMKKLPMHGHPMQMLQTMIAGLGMFYPDDSRSGTDLNDYQDLDYLHTMSVKIIARMPTLVALWERIRNGRDIIAPRANVSFAGNFLHMFTGKEPDPFIAGLMDTCLVLHAEHTINASTFAAMVAGSTLANPYGVIAAATGTLAGPLHGGANQRVIEMLQEIGSPDRVRPWLDKKLNAKEVVWGMGHREYSVKDPRALILQRLMEKLAAHKGGNVSPLFETALALEEATEDRLAVKGVYPNVDFYSGILYAEMGIPTDQFTSIFAVARAAGWLAHWREQLINNRIIRPTQVYVGEGLRDYVPLANREKLQ
ncbi:MAG: citrate synthase [Gammaproteobacteria bacterium]